MNAEVRVRFAPSPTGKLHVGGVRTALFNWLYARRNNGKFLLRIEDTDRERSSQENVDYILNGLKFLNIDWDEELVFQSERMELYAQAVEKLLESGKAYRCFCDPEKLAEEKKRAIAEGNSDKYPGYCKRLSESEIDSRIKSGEKYTVRFKVGNEEISYLDTVHGEIKVSSDDIDDFIILRSDGSATYMLAVVVDDIDMKITNVIRGNDHISNTPKQILLHKALNNKPPVFTHVPLISGSDKKRLSKRHGAVSVLEYKKDGFLSEALVNYLALLGWSPGDEREMMSMGEMTEVFSLERISPRAAVFDPDKLEWMNAQYLSAMRSGEIARRMLDWSWEYGEDDIFRNIDEHYLCDVVDLMKMRMKRLNDLCIYHKYFFTDPVDYDEKGVEKHFRQDWVPEKFTILISDFSSCREFSAAEIERIIRGRAEEWGISAGKLIHPLRLALTGQMQSPGIFELMEMLGLECVLRRLQTAIRYIKSILHT